MKNWDWKFLWFVGCVVAILIGIKWNVWVGWGYVAILTFFGYRIWKNEK